MDNLVERPLEEGRVDGREGFHAFGRQPRCKSDRVLFGQSDIKGALGKHIAKSVNAGP